MSTPTHAWDTGHEPQHTIFRNDCLGWVERIGGSEEWRHNNPCGINADITGTQIGPGIYATYAAGVAAAIANINAHGENTGSMWAWLISGENEGISAAVTNALNLAGIPLDRPISEYTENEKLLLMNAMRQALGWDVGTQSEYHSPGSNKPDPCGPFDSFDDTPGGPGNPGPWHPPTR